MTLMDRYFAARLTGAFFRAVFALLALYILFDLLTHRSSDIISNNVPWTTVVKYYVFQAPLVLSEFQLAALAMLVAGLMVYGAAAQNNEIVALHASGVGLPRILLAPVFTAACISVAVFLMQESVGLAGAKASAHIEQRFFSSSPNAERPGVSWANLPENWTCHILKFNRHALTGENVLMLSYGEDEIERIEAGRIYWDPNRNRWMLEDGLWSRFRPGEGMAATHTRITQQPAPLYETPDNLFVFEAEAATQRVDELAQNLDRAIALGMPSHRIATDLHGKFAKPLLSFVMIWLALPFALRIRRGGAAVGFGVSIAIGLAYLLVFVLAQALGYVGRIPPVTAAWGPNVLFLVVGVALTARTPT